MTINFTLVRMVLLMGWMTWITTVCTGQSRLFYLGNTGAEVLYDVIQLSDGTLLLAGGAENLDWVANTVNRIELDPGTIKNDQGSDRYAFLLHADSSLERLYNLLYLPKGAAEDFRFIKTTNVPRRATGEIYLSGNTEDSEEGGYFIGKLDANFVEGLPSKFLWTQNVACKAGDYPKLYHPWDVDAEGRVYYVRGDSHDWNWSALYRLQANGEPDVVEHWRTHWKVHTQSGGEFRGTPASSYQPGGRDSLQFSAIVFKKDGRCNLRSWTQAAYEQVFPDGNGGTKQGTWPLDVLFDGPCDPDGNPSTSGPGYTGYRPGSSATYGPASVCVDRRNGQVFLGMNTKSVLPGGNPDFEPAVISMKADGQLQWWSRLYHEQRPDNSIQNSTPDQYIDALAIDYSQPLPNSTLVVDARCHGNNIENFWEGNTIAGNPAASGFQNRFTGNSGNIHISWLGKLATNDGTLLASTYVAELAEGTTNLGAPLSDPLFKGWPDPNKGWPDVNTTRLGRNALKVTADGSVLITGYGRRVMTTRNAYLQMPNPRFNGRSAWSYFVRQYQTDLSQPLYSSIVRGVWDTLNAEPALNVEIFNVFKIRSGILLVGQHDGTGEEVPVTGVPEWGTDRYAGESALLGYFEAAEIRNDADAPEQETTTSVGSSNVVPTRPPLLYPNPVADWLHVQSVQPVQRLEVYDLLGRLQTTSKESSISLESLPSGTYLVKTILMDQQTHVGRIIKN